MNFYLQLNEKTIVASMDLANKFSEHLSIEEFQWIKESLVNLPEYISSICSTDPSLTQKILPHPNFFLILFS